MWILQLNEIEKSFGATLILQGITTNIHEKERVGLVGRNGAGKSTLLKIITGELLPDRGQISFAKQKKMGYLAQDSGLKAEQTIWQEMLEPFTPLLMMEKELRRMEEEMASPGVYGNETRLSELTEEYVLLSQRFEEGGGFSFPAKIRSLLSGLGFPEETWDQPITSLSGGQKTRLALVKLLLTEPDLLILDEPTNYLDLSTLTWLENYLRTYPGALLIVSHDRYFLDKLVTRIDELEGGKLHSYTGNYTVYLRQREEERRRQKEAYEAQQEEIKRMEEFVQKNIARASTTKRAQSRRKQLEKMVRLEPPSSPPVLTSFQFEVDQIPGFEVLTVEDLTIGYEKPFSQPTSLTKPLRFQIERGERVAIVGPNGVGKTTLFLTLMGKLHPLGGKIIWGSQVKTAYYDQEQEELNEEKRVIDEIWDEHRLTPEREVRTWLGRFLFRGEEVEKKVTVLSGGERARLQLLKVLLRRANLLLLDEPTNHLDIPSREALEEALLQYPGTLLFISHDRYFLNKIATRTLELTSDGITSYLGNYDYYLEKKEEREEREKEKTALGRGAKGMEERHERAKTRGEAEEDRSRNERVYSPKEPLSYEELKAEKRERRKWERQMEETEEQIEILERSIQEKEGELQRPEIYANYDQTLKLHRELEALKNELDQLLQFWEELTLKLEEGKE